MRRAAAEQVAYSSGGLEHGYAEVLGGIAQIGILWSPQKLAPTRPRRILAALLERVAGRERFTITKLGRPVARPVPVERTGPNRRREAIRSAVPPTPLFGRFLGSPEHRVIRVVDKGFVAFGRHRLGVVGCALNVFAPDPARQFVEHLDAGSVGIDDREAVSHAVVD